jgi:PAS domain S-box-containing protein
MRPWQRHAVVAALGAATLGGFLLAWHAAKRDLASARQAIAESASGAILEELEDIGAATQATSTRLSAPFDPGRFTELTAGYLDTGWFRSAAWYPDGALAPAYRAFATGVPTELGEEAERVLPHGLGLPKDAGLSLTGPFALPDGGRGVFAVEPSRAGSLVLLLDIDSFLGHTLEDVALASVRLTIGSRIVYADGAKDTGARALLRFGGATWQVETGATREPAIGLWLAFGILPTGLALAVATALLLMRASRARERAEHVLLAATEAAEVPVFVKDVESRYLFANSAWLRYAGSTRDEVIGKTDAELFPPHVAGPRRQRDLHVLATGETVDYEQANVVDGEDVVYVSRRNAFRGPNGQVRGLVGVMKDITELRRAETEREGLLETVREQLDQLRQLDRMKDEFLATVSHELRTPLTSILGYVDVGLESPDVPAPAQQAFSVIKRNAERLLRLVEDLLAVARLQSGGFMPAIEPLDLRETVRESIEAARPLAETKGVELRGELTDTALPLSGDRHHLSQVVDNLLSNAIKFTPEGGVVTVRLAEDGESALLEVSDTGIGIPASEQSQLFERFFRASTAMTHAIQGTGLGLTIVRGIVDAHGGEVACTSVEGGGTTFTVRLALDRRQQAAA